MPYEVVATIARGGMGVVELARDESGHSVALKRLTLRGTAEEMHAARQRLEREVTVLQSLDHPAIVNLLDVHDDGGELVLVMPYLAGGTLAERVARNGPLSSGEVTELAGTLLAALTAAHRAGVVHRDVKPANVLFDEKGRPHLADFGIATTRDATGGLTGDGLVIGTPAYLSPEQARGEPATAASDVFSLGATLQFALTGEGPFGTGDPRVVLVRAARGDIASLPRSVDSPLRRQIGRMLDSRPERRPAAAELAAGPEGTLVMPSARRRQRGLLAAVVAATIIAMGAAVGFALSSTPGGSGSTDDGDELAAPSEQITTTACVPLPYQRCGALEPAPFTDGHRCIDDHADYDGIAENGCEAAPMGPEDGSELVDEIVANLVPADDVDTFVTHVEDKTDFLFCNGQVRIGITSPRGAAVRLVVSDPEDEMLGEITSADGVTAELKLDEPSCSNDETTLTLEVSSIGSDRTAEPYVLTREGNY